MRGESGIRIIAPAVEPRRSSGVVQGRGVTTVWDVIQTSGGMFELPSLEVIAGVTPVTVCTALTDVACAAGYQVVRGRPQSATALAETQFSRHRIIVRDDLSPALSVMGLAHELAHLRMHKMSRSVTCHGLSRLEADCVGYLVLARFGCLPDVPPVDLVGDAARTVGRKPPTRLVETLGGRVVTAAQRLVQATEKQMSAPTGTEFRVQKSLRSAAGHWQEPEPHHPGIGPA
ncbi:hypothetical protein ACIA49_33165 [Kribbella sp. NPDC051587]|uniref:hypothetical protein n=1 Tax=Kribbella sp. NPDC051587 TaxID=3364119 RepID=UPI0037A209EE